MTFSFRRFARMLLALLVLRILTFLLRLTICPLILWQHIRLRVLRPLARLVRMSLPSQAPAESLSDKTSRVQELALVRWCMESMAQA